MCLNNYGLISNTLTKLALNETVHDFQLEGKWYRHQKLFVLGICLSQQTISVLIVENSELQLKINLTELSEYEHKK